jgi:uncharacterized protein (TIGR01777 family)
VRVTLTGATGLIGARLVERLRARGDEVTVLSRSPERARESLGVEAVRWDPLAGPAPADALAGRDGVAHLAGESVAQRWSERAKRSIRESRVAGTRHLVDALREAEPRPRVLVSASAVGIYGPRGEEPVDEATPPGDDFLARVCVDWEREADAAAEAGLRVVKLRTGVALHRDGGALKQMLPPFRLGLGGPVAGGRQFMPWIHLDDVVGMYLAALDSDAWEGPVNATAPQPVTNRDFSRALGRVLHRPAVAPVPGLAVRLLFGEMSMVVTTGQRAIPARAREAGYDWAHPEVEGALRAALG